MATYDNILDKLENLKSSYKKLSDSDLELSLYESAGMVLFSLQTTEFLIHGLISHFKDEVLKSNKKISKLDAKTFLSDDENSKKARKQTLGMILSFLTEKTNLFDQNDFEKYLTLRNDFIHNFWRIYLSKNKISDRNELYKALNFIIDIAKEDTKWSSIFKGMLYSFATEIAKKIERNPEPFEVYRDNYSDYLEYLIKKKK